MFRSHTIIAQFQHSIGGDVLSCISSNVTITNQTDEVFVAVPEKVKRKPDAVPSDVYTRSLGKYKMVMPDTTAIQPLAVVRKGEIYIFSGVLGKWTELNWTELYCIELNWTELDWIGLNWTEFTVIEVQGKRQIIWFYISMGVCPSETVLSTPAHFTPLL